MGFFIYLCVSIRINMKGKIKIQPMTGIQKMIQAKKLKEKAEEMEEAMMEAQMMSMYSAMKSTGKKRK